MSDALDPPLAAFVADCRAALAADPGPRGRNRVRERLEAALATPGFVDAHVDPAGPERHVLYRDGELGFVVLAHSYRAAGEARPHDHGPSWAIYGQASGETEMSDWTAVVPAAEGRPGTARYGRSYTLRPGMAFLYNEGDLHALKRAGPTRLIRIEGTDLSAVRRFSWRPE
ncbi:MAG TPA: hypothetical protein VHD15_16535 [Hyphomicrobiales bacterium]|nr:hypothetical protein [Hyphomicrobiales bacterium]